jgi:hypothetical protein
LQFGLVPPGFALGEQVMPAAARKHAERPDRDGPEKVEAISPQHEAEHAVNFIKDPSMVGAIRRAQWIVGRISQRVRASAG